MRAATIGEILEIVLKVAQNETLFPLILLHYGVFSKNCGYYLRAATNKGRLLLQKISKNLREIHQKWIIFAVKQLKIGLFGAMSRNFLVIF